MICKRLALVALSSVAAACSGGAANVPVDNTTTGQDNTGYGMVGTPDADSTTKATEAPVFPEEAFRAQQPKEAAPRPFQLPKMQHFKLQKQIDVYLVENHDLPTITAELNFDGGSMTDPRSKVGLASVCMDLLSDGTKKLDKLAFEEALANTASTISSYAGRESQGVTLRTLSAHWDETFPLFVDTITTPGFRKDELERVVNRRIEQLKQTRATVPSVARRLVSNVAFGDRHPFGQLVTEKTLGKIQTRDCVRYHKSYIKPRGARLFVVGDMTKDQIEKAFAPLLAKWKGRGRHVARMPKPRPRNGRVFFVNIPNAKQSAILFLHFGPQRDADDFFANMMMAKILGGGFSSRINMNLREDKGYAYGAFGGFNYGKSFGLFFAASNVRTTDTVQSVVEIFNEIEALKSGKEPATTTELSREKNGAIRGLPGDFGTSQQSLGMYRDLVYYGLPLDYYNSYAENLLGVTEKAVAASAKTHLHPEKLHILVVGDANAPVIVREDGKDVPLMKDGKQVTLLDGLRDLLANGTIGKGKLVILDADGHVTKIK